MMHGNNAVEKVSEMDKRKKSIHMNILHTVVMAVFVGLIMLITYRQITDLAVKDCFQKLWDQTSRMRDELKANVDSDTRLLEAMSGMLAELPDMTGEEAQKILAFEKTGNLVEEVELLFPDGTRLGTDGIYPVESIVLDYETEAARGAHITGKVWNPQDPEEWNIYNIVPVLYSDEVEALLCGRISLTKLQEDYHGVMKGNGSRFHLIEAQSSELLIDTMHDSLGKADLSGRIAREGDSVETVMENMLAGRPGELTFYSNTIQEFLYGVYEPVGIQDWTVMLGIPESIAFESVVKIKMFFFACAVMEALVLMIYFTVLLVRSRKMADELEEQYRISQELRQIQELLFHSVLKPERMTRALERLAGLLTAERVHLATNLRQNGPRFYHSSPVGEQELLSEQEFQSLMKALEAKGQISFYDVDELNIMEEEKERLRQMHICSGMAIVLSDSDNKYRGILFAVNMTRVWQGVEPLEWIRYDFSMALDNMAAFQRIRELGSRDQLTGLLNRNSYQKAVELYEKMGDETLNCVYVDADGLHELNNQLGHMEGDRMLTTISQFLRDIFGDEMTYRIGGDEFLIFCQGTEEEQMEWKCKTLERLVADAGYHISIGRADRREAPLVYEMVRLAESRMYEVKRQYYRERKNGQKVREMNRQLEATLLEKKDLDAFCQVLSYKYLGVYIVNLSRDTTRSINIPDYFEEKLEQAGRKFSEAIRLYIQSFVEPEYHEEFLELLDYEKLFQRLSREQRPQLVYLKRDGNYLLIQIHPTPEFNEFHKECIWTFEVQEAEKQVLGKQ